MPGVHVRLQIGVPLIEIRNMYASLYPCSLPGQCHDCRSVCPEEPVRDKQRMSLVHQEEKKCGDALIVEGKRLDLQGQTMRQTQHSKYRPHHRHPLR